MGPQSHGSPKFGNFGIPTWESWDKMPVGCGPHGCGSSQHQKCSNYALNTLCWFCTSPCEQLKLVNSSQSHPRAPTRPSTPPKCCEPGNVPRILALPMFYVWDSYLESLKELGTHHPALLLFKTCVLGAQMGHVSPFQTSKFQELSNDIKDSSIQ